jgi:hypothetical protein
MTFQNIDVTHTAAPRLPTWGVTRQTVYNLAAVAAVMIAAGIVASAYHPSNSTVMHNLRLESMGGHVPTAFKGAPPVSVNR